MLALTLCIAFVSAVSSSPDESACRRNGEFIQNPKDVCSYFRCDYGDGYGHNNFVEVSQNCPYGTSTNRKKFDPRNPCGEFSDQCGNPPKSKCRILARPRLKNSWLHKVKFIWPGAVNVISNVLPNWRAHTNSLQNNKCYFLIFVLSCSYCSDRQFFTTVAYNFRIKN